MVVPVKEWFILTLTLLKRWKVFFFIPCCRYTDRRAFRTDEYFWKELPFSQKNAACVHASRKFLMPARTCLGGAVHDQNKPMQNRLPALICIEQELPSNGEETPNTLFTWTVSVIGYEKDSQQENSYYHHRDSVPTAPLSPSCFHAFIS